MKTLSNKAFTLVELIVTITILSILGTIGFISIQGYSSKSRDSVRVSDIATLSKGIETLFAKGQNAPRPNGSVDITASGQVIAYQGYAGTGLLSVLAGSAMKDPLDSLSYTYVTNASGNRYQLLGFTENQVAFGSSSLLVDDVFAADYSTRAVVTRGNKLGIILNSGNKSPIQETGTGIDVITTTVPYMAIFSKDVSVTGTGTALRVVTASVATQSGQSFVRSCKEILDYAGYAKDGYYFINPAGTGAYQVYCDMTTDGGGWTQLVKYSFNQATTIESNNDGGAIMFETGSSTLNITRVNGGHRYRVSNFTGSIANIYPVPRQIIIQVSAGISTSINSWNNPSATDPNPNKSIYTEYSICDSQLVPQVATPTYRDLSPWVLIPGAWNGAGTLTSGIKPINMTNKLTDEFRICMTSNAWPQLSLGTGGSSRPPTISNFNAFFR